MKNVRIPYILRTLPKFHVFNILKLFGAIFLFVIVHGHYMIIKFLQESVEKITYKKILKKSQGYEEHEDSSCSFYPQKFSSFLIF